MLSSGWCGPEQFGSLCSTVWNTESRTHTKASLVYTMSNLSEEVGAGCQYFMMALGLGASGRCCARRKNHLDPGVPVSLGRFRLASFRASRLSSIYRSACERNIVTWSSHVRLLLYALATSSAKLLESSQPCKYSNEEDLWGVAPGLF